MVGCVLSINGAFGPTLKFKSHREACRDSIDNHPFHVFLAEKLKQVVDDLGMLDDPHERLATVIDRAKKIPPLPSTDRTDANRVRGCVSVVWLVGEMRGGRCYFRSDAESPVVRGLLAFLCDFFDGALVDEVAASDLEPLDALHITQNLSPTRRNGLAAARNAIRTFARSRLEESVKPANDGKH
jgi:cysteine desulfuration protein SufE